MYLQFETLTQAETANNKIAENMGLSGDITSGWSDITETDDNKFVIIKPDNRFLAQVSNYQEIETIKHKKTSFDTITL
jgi:hypothetical protein